MSDDMKSKGPTRRALLKGALTGALVATAPAMAMPTPQSTSEVILAKTGRTLRVPIDAQSVEVELDGQALRPGRDFVVSATGEVRLTAPRLGAGVASVGFKDEKGSWRWSSYKLV